MPCLVRQCSSSGVVQFQWGINKTLFKYPSKISVFQHVQQTLNQLTQFTSYLYQHFGRLLPTCKPPDLFYWHRLFVWTSSGCLCSYLPAWCGRPCYTNCITHDTRSLAFQWVLQVVQKDIFVLCWCSLQDLGCPVLFWTAEECLLSMLNCQ